jgi:hypothetical protein
MSFLGRVHRALALLMVSHSADVVGILGDDLLELPGVEVFLGVVAQVQDDAGAALGAGDGFHLEVAGAAADPAHALVGLEARTARFHGDLVGHDEARIEAHAELADELRILLLVARELAHEVLGAALGDGAQVVDGLLLAHADAVVGDGQRLGGLVEAHAHFEVGGVFVQGVVVQGLEAQLVASIRGIGNQLAQEDFLVGVQRMGDQVQQLGHLGLEGQGLFAHGWISLGGVTKNRGPRRRKKPPAGARQAAHRGGWAGFKAPRGHAAGAPVVQRSGRRPQGGVSRGW